jgi:hypothetical protein
MPWDKTSSTTERRGRGEPVDDLGIAERVDAHSDLGLVRLDVAPEDLADADLGRALGAILVADHPQRHHVAQVVDRLGAQLEQPSRSSCRAAERSREPHCGRQCGIQRYSSSVSPSNSSSNSSS